MATYLLRRLVYAVVVIVGVTFILTVMLDLIPGGPAVQFLGENATPAQIKIINQQLGVDQPVLTRYVDWLGDAAKGDLGTSFTNKLPVADLIWEKLPVTAELVFLSQFVAVTFAITMGVYTANKPSGFLDRSLTGISQVVLGMPSFVTGLLLALAFAVKIRLLPIAGFVDLKEGLFDNLEYMVLPVIAVAADPAVIYWRVLRADLSRTLREDYILMAEAKGLSSRKILFRHALRPSMFTMTTIAGINTARLIGTTLIIEQIFALPGMGRLLIDSIRAYDYPVVQGTVVVIALIFVLTNTLVDLLYSALDPRVVRRGAH